MKIAWIFRMQVLSSGPKRDWPGTTALCRVNATQRRQQAAASRQGRRQGISPLAPSKQPCSLPDTACTLASAQQRLQARWHHPRPAVASLTFRARLPTP